MTNIERLADLTKELTVELSQLKWVDTAICQTVDAVVMTDANLTFPGPTITYVNSAFEKLTGYAEVELIGRSPRILQGPLTDRSTIDRMKSALCAGRCCREIVTNYRKDGETYTAECTITPVRDDNEMVGGFVSIQRLVDISK